MPGGTGRLLVRTLVFSLERARWSWNGTGLDRGVVFGTLLGPEATGPGMLRFLAAVFSGLFVSGFLAAPIARFVSPLWGVCGVCGLGLLFENYIVDASIFYKKQFPRI